MSSEEKSIKKSNKFNYLVADSLKDKLLGRYDQLNFSPPKYNRVYNKKSIEKKQQNSEKPSLSSKKTSMANTSSKYYNREFVSFGKSRNYQDISDSIKQNQEQPNSQSNIGNNPRGNPKKQSVDRVRNKSFGNISVKRKALQNTDERKSRILEFSPYKEEQNIDEKQEVHSFRPDRQAQVQKYSKELYSTHKNLLINELEEQQLIIRNQLKEYEYQNELLRQKLQYLETDNSSLKLLVEKQRKQISSLQAFYEDEFNSQTLTIKQMESKLQILQLEKQKLQTNLAEERYLTADMKHQIGVLLGKLEQLQITLNAKDQLIIQLNNKLQLERLEKSNFIEPLQNKRRKSLDLTTQGRLKYLPPQTNDVSEERKSRTNSIGRLMNKTLTHGLQMPEESRVGQKQNNLIQSIKSMYFKINSKEVKDLKQLWKWLKTIAHQYQSYFQFYSMRDKIFAILDYYEENVFAKKSEEQLQFLEIQPYNIIKRLGDILLRNQ